MIERGKLGAAVLSCAAVAALAAWTSETPVRACEASFTPSAVRVSSDPVSVLVEMSEPIGMIQEVAAEDGSGIEPGGYDAQMNALELSVAEAHAGDWEITFHGAEEMTCTGSLTVEEGD
ncbi:MAG: hypothetical protein R3E10_10740 [Gemmatimonadota bacterium]